MLLLNSDQVLKALPMDEAIDCMKQALSALSAGRVQLPLRTHIDLPQHSGTTLIMPAHVNSEDGDESLAVKVVSVFRNNMQRDLARIQAVVNVFDPETGVPIAIIEGATLTGIRTAAASGAATDVLARPDARRLAIIGAGVQARTHLAAICAIRDIEQVKIFAPRRQQVDVLIDEAVQECEMVACDTANEAISNADIICTVTTSQEPVFDAGNVSPGTHINAVGSYQPHVVEIPSETVSASRVYVDHSQSALEEAGDLIQPINSGAITGKHVQGEIGAVLLGSLPGRLGRNDITLFKSVGNAAEDAVAAQLVVTNAAKLGLGQSVDF